MKRPAPSRRQSPFFSVVAFIITFTLFLTTSVNAGDDDPTGLSGILQQFYSLIFDAAPSGSMDPAGDMEQTTATDSTDDNDPTEPPPPPIK